MENILSKKRFTVHIRKLIEVYCIRNLYVDSIRVGNTTYFYDLILLCKDVGYVDVWGDYMKSRWNWENPKHMKTLLNHLKGRVTRLDDF